jgi:uncharacterized membrane protein YbaN (DUF454 family)
MRLIWIVFGGVSLLLGVVGIVLPLLPTVPFLLLSAFCFARSSKRLHAWLVTHPKLGPPIEDWNRRGAISRRAKWLSTASVAVAFSLSFLFGVGTILIAIQAVTLIGVLIFIWTRPD